MSSAGPSRHKRSRYLASGYSRGSTSRPTLPRKPPTKPVAEIEFPLLESSLSVDKMFRRGYAVIRKLQEEGSVRLKLSSTARPTLITLTRKGKTMLTTLQGSGSGHPYCLFKKQFDLKDFGSPIFKELIHSLGDQSHADNVLSALLMQQTLLAPTKSPPFSQHLLKKGVYPFFQGECFEQLTRLMLNKRDFDLPAKTEKELFDQLLTLAGLFSAPASDHLQQSSRIFLPSFNSGARFLATSLVKYFGLKVSCEDAKTSCCVRAENGYSCSQCCLFHSKHCKRLFTHFQ